MAQSVNAAGEREPVIAPGRARRMYVGVIVAVIAILAVYGIYELIVSGRESTDDAQVAADVVAIAPRVPGQVVTVSVKENQRVKRGDLIAEIDPRDLQVKLAQTEGEVATAEAQLAAAEARLPVSSAAASGGHSAATAAVQGTRDRVASSESAIAEARAGVSRAEANARKAAADWSRASELGGKGDISKAQVDAARASNEAAQADLASAQAKLGSAERARQLAASDVLQAEGKLQQSAPVGAQIRAAQAETELARARVRTAQASREAAKLNLSYTRIMAPADGIASRLMVHPGSLVVAGQSIVQLVPTQTYLIANFKETQVREMRAGQKARVKIDALGSREFEGSVDSLSGGTGATFSLLPPDNASGNFVKVVQRVPVRIRWQGPPSDQIPVGASAEVTVYTK